MRKLLAAIAVLGACVFSGAASAHTADVATIVVGAHTSFDRTYNWVVTKTDSAHSSVTIAQNQAYTLTYTVTVGSGTPAYTDSNWVVQDGISILGNGTNFGINALGDITSIATQGAIQTAGTTEYCATDDLYANKVTLSPSSLWPKLLCHYVIALPNGSPGTVNASVTYSDGSVGTGSAPFDFNGGLGSTLEKNQPVIHNGTVSVVDSQAGTIGTVTSDHPSQTFTYTTTIPSSTCGTSTIPNTVNLIGDHGAVVATATDNVQVTVTCPHTAGCTFTQGYWKTHSIYGPAAQPDPTWSSVGGPNATFFLSGQSWLQVFNTTPAGGNVYYQLAHQYEAAVLNQNAGASSTSAVTAAMADALAFFKAYTPAQAAALSKSSPIRAAALSDASTLDDYNSGLIGPGHCGNE